jgi:metal-sulfur cluster biosynthetic enzyme
MAETKATETKTDVERVWDALREVYDPEIPINVVDLGLVRKVEEVDDEIHVTMILTAPFCPLASMILEQARTAAQAASEKPVQVTLGTERWDPSMMAEEGREKLGMD